MPRTIAVLLISSLVAAGIAVPRGAQAQRVVLSGQVIDAQTKAPVRAALVELAGKNRRAITDSLGRFAFADLAPARYALVASSLGYEETRVPLDVHEGGSATIEIQPQPVLLKAVEALAASRTRNVNGMRVRIYGRDQLRAGDDVSAATFVHEHAHLPVAPCDALLPAWNVRHPEPLSNSWLHGEDCISYRPPFGGKPVVLPVLVYVDGQAFYYYSSELNAHQAWDLGSIEVYTRSAPSPFVIVRVYTSGYMERRAAKVAGICDQLAKLEEYGGRGLWSACMP